MGANNELLVLGIETSCDETSAAVVRGGVELLSNVISSQIDLQRLFGGVVPEVASRRHVEKITLIIEEALEKAGIGKQQIDAVAVTHGPGLVGALLIGLSAAKAFSFSMDIPLIGVHHIAGHIYANQLVQPLTFPLVALVVSGGHTDIIHMENHHQFALLGKTRDDAVGEAFDKVGRVMKLPYPAGPYIDALARKGKPIYDLPRARLEPGSFDFSFSGLKTAVLQLVNRLKKAGEEVSDADLACSFQEAVIDVLEEKTIRAVKSTGVKQLVLGGGVSANSRLRQRLEERCAVEQIQLRIPPMELCTDNAGMIAAAGTYQLLEGKVADLSLNPNPNLTLSN